MPGPGYPVARAVARRVESHFARHLGGQTPSRARAQAPTAEVIEAIADAAFWASLRSEEGYTPRISLAYLSPKHCARPLLFENPLPLLPENLTRLAPAVEGPGVHLGVWNEDGQFHVWGATRTIPACCFVLEVISQGLLVIKHRRGDRSSKFVNVAVLEGDQIKILRQDSTIAPSCPAMITSLLSSDSFAPEAESTDLLTRLAISMRTHGRGGTLMVVPAHSEQWRESIVWPSRYVVSPPFTELADLINLEKVSGNVRPWKDSLRQAVDSVAGLTAVDGATVITNEYAVLAFGAKIRRREGAALVDTVLLSEPVEGAETTQVYTSELGGTRHMSAAQFAQDQPDSTVFVASQDGRFTLFAWSESDNMVRAQRVESLLL